MSTSPDDSTVFFTADAGPSLSFDPYAGIEGARDARQDQIESLLGDADSIARAILTVPERRLAWHLTAPPALAPRAIDFARSLRDATLQRTTAAHLLAEAIAGETAGITGPVAAERWGTVDRLWQELAWSRHAASELGEVARCLGLPEPESTAKKVLAAITAELLPSLHLIFAAAARDPEHRELHLRGAGEAPAHPLTNVARAVLRAEQLVDARRLRDAGQHCRALHAYLAFAPETHRERPQLALEIGSLAEQVEKSAQAYLITSALGLVTALTKAMQAYPFDARICRAAAALHMRCGVLLVNDCQFNAGGAHFVRAMALDPRSPEPQGLLLATREALIAAGHELAAAVKKGHTLNQAGLSLLAEVRGDLCQVAALAESYEFWDLRNSYEKALSAELALRLGLDPSEPREHVAALAIVEELNNESERGASLDERMARLLADHPDLAGAPWELIRAAEERGEPLSAEGLIAALPAPPRAPEKLDDSALDQAILRMREASSRRAAPRRFSAARAYPWLFSRVDLPAKVAAVAGLSLILVGGGRLAGNALDANRRNGTYAELRSAATEARHEDVIRAARRFIASTASGADDYRAREVARAYRKALLQEITRTAAGGSEQELPRLLADARALEAWTPNESAPEKEGEGQ